jgi:hypothetical protein
MQRSRPTLHLFGERLANEKKRLEAQLAELQQGRGGISFCRNSASLIRPRISTNGSRRRGCNRRKRSEAMADYRAYIVGEDGHFLDCEATCRDDRAAVEWAKQLVSSRVIELWCGERFVANFEPNPE